MNRNLTRLCFAEISAALRLGRLFRARAPAPKSLPSGSPETTSGSVATRYISRDGRQVDGASAPAAESGSLDPDPATDRAEAPAVAVAAVLAQAEGAAESAWLVLDELGCRGS
jgi:hypothetical protein